MRELHEARMCAGARITGGIVLLTLGVVFLLTNLGIVQWPLLRIWWPLLLIFLGVMKLVRRAYWHRPRGSYNNFA